MLKGLLMKLRFKKADGTSYPNWTTMSLSDIGVLGSSGIDKKYNPEDQEVYMVNFMDVYTKKSVSKESYKTFMKTTAPKEKLSKSLLRKHDMLFLLASETSDDIGHSIVIEDDFDDLVHSYHTVLFRPHIKLDLKFQKYFCNTTGVLRQFSKISKGQIRVFITKNDFNDIKISLPCLEEQAKIADFFTAIDEKITLINAQLSQLNLYKQAQLQIIFSPENTTNWANMRLGDVCELEYGKSLVKDDRIQGNYPVYGSNGIVDYHNNYCVTAPNIIVGRKGSAGEVFYSDIQCWVIDTAYSLKSLKNYNLRFVYYLLKFTNLSSLIIGNAVPGLNRNDFYNCKVTIPTSLEEQAKIADYLSALDDKITNTQQSLEQIKSYKLAMLQKMIT